MKTMYDAIWIRQKKFCFSLITGIFFVLLTATDIFAATQDERQNKDTNSLLSCGYITSNIKNTIFSPNFVLFLAKHLQTGQVLTRHQVENAVNIWNLDVTDKRKRIRFQDEHFRKMAKLSKSMRGCGSNCKIDKASLQILQSWMSELVIDLDKPVANHITPGDLKKFNVESDRDIDRALGVIQKDPVAKQLLAYAIHNEITIIASRIHRHDGYFDCKHREITIHPSVASYIFKINCIVHELVHASYLDSDNSVLEETIAEIIGMRVQDKITDIDISCSSYMVLISRLIDKEYGNLPIRNDIVNHLRKAGIHVHLDGKRIE